MKLFQGITLGGKSVKNRMVMAPMTRSRANTDGLAGDLTVLYYTQRASAGLIVSEGINISGQALGSPLTPGIYTKDQINAWRKVTQSVHEKGSVMYAQLWHTGRVGHSSDKKGALPVAPSAISITGQQHFTMNGLQDYEIPRALTVPEIKQIVQDYKQAAINAMEAGFDGVELHAANGYLPDEFMADGSNQRTDEYGGNIENRNRFVLEVMQTLVDTLGSDKTGIRLSPTNPYNAISHSNPVAQFTPLLEALNKMPLSYAHLINTSFPADKFPNYPKNVIETFGVITKHTLIANGGYTQKTGEAELEKGIAGMISYGTLFIANPDLPKRFKLNSSLNVADRTTFFGGGEKGYTDYQFLEA